MRSRPQLPGSSFGRCGPLELLNNFGRLNEENSPASLWSHGRTQSNLLSENFHPSMGVHILWKTKTAVAVNPSLLQIQRGSPNSEFRPVSSSPCQLVEGCDRRPKNP